LEARATLLAAGWRLLIDGWEDEGVHRCDAALAKLRDLGSHALPDNLIVYASVQRFQSKYQEARQNADLALLGLTEGDPWDSETALMIKAFALLYLGHLGDAYRTLKAGIEVASKNENIQSLSRFRTYLAMVHWHACDYEEVRALSNEAVPSALPNPVVEVWHPRMMIFRGFADLAIGKCDLALQNFELVRERQPRRAIAQWYWRMLAQLGVSESWLGLGDLTKANAEADALINAVSACDEAC